MVEDLSGRMYFAVQGMGTWEDEIEAKEQSSFPSRVPAVQGYSADEGAATLTLFPNEVVEQFLQDFLGYKARRKDGSYVKGTIMSISRVDAWAATMVNCLAEKKKGWSTAIESIRQRLRDNGRY